MDYDGYNIDISSDPITNDYTTIDIIQRHRQAGQYGTYTGMGGGVYEARQLLAEHGRHGARPTLLVIGEGNANRSPGGWSLPNDWDYTVHSMSVGAGADRDLMEAIAFAGGGTWIDVPGGSTIAAMQEQMLAAFSQIAAKVPPPKLVFED